MMEQQGGTDAETGFHHADALIDQALEWFVRLNDCPGAESQAQFDAWLSSSEAHRAAWEEVAGVWRDPAILAASQQLAERQETNVVPLTPRARRPLRHYAMAAAATLLLAAALPHIMPQLITRWQADYLTAVGETREVRLPDGSRMVLNTGSAVALDFREGRRGARLLQGEAWFDVAHDPSRPFHVAGQFSDVRVKGTMFSVRRQADGDRIALQAGVVEAVHENPAVSPIRLEAGEMAHASSAAISAIPHFESDEALGWLEGRIIFSGKPLGKALDAIGAYLDGRVIVLNRDILNVAVSGNYRTDSAETAMEGVVAAAGGKITRLPGGILIIR